MGTGREIRLIENDDESWSAVDEQFEVATHGETRRQALENLDEAVKLHDGEGDDPIADEAAYLEELGIDPEDVVDTRELPEFMKG